MAALEAALALRELAGDRVSTTLLAPEPEFVYRPMHVREPFGYRRARTHALQEIASDIGAELIPDALKGLDSSRSIVHTRGDVELEYDALLLAIGAQLDRAFSHGLTLDDRKLDDQLHGLIQDVEGGYVRSLAFIAPSPMPWPLPLYELALMTAERTQAMMGAEASVTIVTPEDAPLAVFGPAVSEAVGELLERRGIDAILGHQCGVTGDGKVWIQPGDRTLDVDRVVALPRLSAPSTPGVPDSTHGGFIPIDSHCRVPTLEHVWAAGDVTDFPVKHGGIASQQADTAAGEIARLAGASVESKPFGPELHAILLGGIKPLYLSACLSETGAYSSNSDVSETPTWSSPAKIAAKYLAPYLESRDRPAAR